MKHSVHACMTRTGGGVSCPMGHRRRLSLKQVTPVGCACYRVHSTHERASCVGTSRYTGLEQSLLLAQAVLVKKGTAHDELQEWEMAPYVEAVLTQANSHFMLQVCVCVRGCCGPLLGRMAWCHVRSLFCCHPPSYLC